MKQQPFHKNMHFRFSSQTYIFTSTDIYLEDHKYFCTSAGCIQSLTFQVTGPMYLSSNLKVFIITTQISLVIAIIILHVFKPNHDSNYTALLPLL